MKTLIIVINLIVFLYLSVGVIRVIFNWRKFDTMFHRLYYALYWLPILLEARRIIKITTHCYEEGGASEYINKESYISQVLEMTEGDTTEERIKQACRTIDYIYTFKPTANRLDGR